MYETFGRVVAALRADRRDENWLPWTQEQLGEATGLGVHIIGKIEQGKRAPNPATLAALADALYLTAWERRELAVLALGDPLTSPPAEPGAGERAWRRQLDVLASLSLPAFLYDDFGDLVAANTRATWLVGLSRETLETDDSWQDARYHAMRVVCDPALGYASRLGAGWEQIALRQMLFFRRVSLKRRAEPAMADRLQELRRLPQFRRLWDEAIQVRDWPEPSLIEYAHEHPATGQPLRYLGAPTVQPTPWGELILGMFVPLEAATAAAFADLVQENEAVMLADWPKKPTG
ncbi:MAG: helix-turn-helix domain-containing protein [Anaerolineae bacterium]